MQSLSVCVLFKPYIFYHTEYYLKKRGNRRRKPDKEYIGVCKAACEKRIWQADDKCTEQPLHERKHGLSVSVEIADKAE